MVQLEKVIDLHTFSITACDRETAAVGVAVGAGNMLAAPDVIVAMARTFRANDGERRDLSERLLLALEAGQTAGGDKRGKQSAALLVAAAREPRMYHNLRVDDHADPVAELRRIWEGVVAHSQRIGAADGRAAGRLLGRRQQLACDAVA